MPTEIVAEREGDPDQHLAIGVGRITAEQNASAEQRFGSQRTRSKRCAAGRVSASRGGMRPLGRRKRKKNQQHKWEAERRPGRDRQIARAELLDEGKGPRGSTRATPPITSAVKPWIASGRPIM